MGRGVSPSVVYRAGRYTQESLTILHLGANALRDMNEPRFSPRLLSLLNPPHTPPPPILLPQHSPCNPSIPGRQHLLFSGLDCSALLCSKPHHPFINSLSYSRTGAWEMGSGAGGSIYRFGQERKDGWMDGYYILMKLLPSVLYFFPPSLPFASFPFPFHEEVLKKRMGTYGIEYHIEAPNLRYKNEIPPNTP